MQEKADVQAEEKKAAKTEPKQGKDSEAADGKKGTAVKTSAGRAAGQATAGKPGSPASGSAPREDPAYEEAFEKGKIAGLQEAILAIMEKNGPITDKMRRDVTENVYHDSLIAWVKSFR